MAQHRLVAVLIVFTLCGAAKAQDVNDAKKQIEILNRGLGDRMRSIREELRNKQIGLAKGNIQAVTPMLKELERLAKEVQKNEPGYLPNPPIDFDKTPAISRYKEFEQAKKLTIEGGKQINKNCQDAKQALLKAKNRQMATIAISALKFTVENAPGRPGGELLELEVEGIKKLNSYLLGSYVSSPITNSLSDVQLLKDNVVSIADGEKLVAACEENLAKVMELAKQVNQEAKNAKETAEVERAWQAFRGLRQTGSKTIRVQIVDYQSRSLELSIHGTVLDLDSKGKTLEVPAHAVVAAKVKDDRRKFCLVKKAYAQKTKAIILHPGPGGGEEDSLVYSSIAVADKSSWLIQEETFDWKPSSNTSMEDEPAIVSNVYWKLKKGRILWMLPAESGQQFNLSVNGQIQWQFDQALPDKREKKQETNEGAATLVLRVVD